VCSSSEAFSHMLLCDAPHAEAVNSRLKLFHTVSEGEFSEVRIRCFVYLPELSLLEQRSGRTKTADRAMVHGPMAQIKPNIIHLNDAQTSLQG
jgi:hypothetical protein